MMAGEYSCEAAAVTSVTVTIAGTASAETAAAAGVRTARGLGAGLFGQNS